MSRRHESTAEQLVDEPELAEESLRRWNKDLKAAAATLSERQARYVIDVYYSIQKQRIVAKNQEDAARKAGEPNAVVALMRNNFAAVEVDIKKAMAVYTDQQVVSRWAKSIVGIGPVLAAGLVAHIDPRRSPTAGGVWRFAGLDPSNEWLGAEKARALVMEVLGPKGAPTTEHLATIATRVNRRLENITRAAAAETGAGEKITRKGLIAALAKRPYNARLKVICWKIGESFVKVQNHQDDVYGHLIVERKAIESAKNEAGDFRAQAEESLPHFDKSTDAYKAYKQGKLPPARIHLRAQRWGVKLFLAHWHHVARESLGLEVPKPYILTQPGHAHFVKPPHWPLAE